jgi:hypothetical protein
LFGGSLRKLGTFQEAEEMKKTEVEFPPLFSQLHPPSSVLSQLIRKSEDLKTISEPPKEPKNENKYSIQGLHSAASNILK